MTLDIAGVTLVTGSLGRLWLYIGFSSGSSLGNKAALAAVGLPPASLTACGRRQLESLAGPATCHLTIYVGRVGVTLIR